MKKAKRWTALLLMVLMCLSLCGCQNLEDMRAAHAFWQEDGSIKWNGNVYLPLTGVPEGFLFFYEQTVHVTEPDVPVLLSDTLGESFTVDEKGVILHSWNWDGAETYFCREDKYDYIMEYLQEDIGLTTYYYSYWPDYDADEEYYYLSETQGNTIDRLMVTLDFAVMDEEFYYSFEAEDFSVTLGKCDEEHLFSDVHILEIAQKGGQFYLITPDEYIAEVPAEYGDIMKIIVSVYYNAEVKPYL